MEDLTDNKENTESGNSAPADGGKSGKDRHGLIKGIALGVALTFLAGVLYRGYISIPFGRMGVATVKFPYYELLHGDNSDGGFDTTEITRKVEEIGNFINSAYMYDADQQEIGDWVATGMMYSLTDEDKYATYYSKEAFEDETKRLKGSYKGIGVTAAKNEESGGVTVVSVTAEGPAQRAGIKAGDIIIEADGTDLKPLSLEESVDIISGEEGTVVHLVVLRDGEELEFDITREEIRTITVRGKMADDTDIAFISITSFDQSTEEEFKEILDTLMGYGAKGLVLDLRNNLGGDMNISIDMLDYMLDDSIEVVDAAADAPDYNGKTVLLSVEDKDGKSELYTAGDGHGIDIPIAVIVNGYTASAAEIMSGALKDYGCEIIGTQTYGKGIVQTIYNLEDGSAVRLTTNRYRLPGGELIHEIGITPTVELEFEEFDGVTSGQVNFAEGEETDILKDNQAMKAIEIIQDKINAG